MHFKRSPASLFLYTFSSLLIKSVSLQVYETLENTIKKCREKLSTPNSSIFVFPIGVNFMICVIQTWKRSAALGNFSEIAEFDFH